MYAKHERIGLCSKCKHKLYGRHRRTRFSPPVVY
jgi:hypothetical protein